MTPAADPSRTSASILKQDDGLSFLALANEAFRSERYEPAIANYMLASALLPQMQRTLDFNLERSLRSFEEARRMPCDAFSIVERHIQNLAASDENKSRLREAVQGVRAKKIARIEQTHLSAIDRQRRYGPAGGALDAREIKVSVVCITYNHEQYIRQALDGFVMQQTSFRFEVIIGDDGSTDATQQIISEYSAIYPGLFVPVLREKNIGIANNLFDIMQRVKGEYVAMNEGDDYWTDPHKLQLQVEHLDANPACALCFHPVKVINDDDPRSVSIFPSDLTGERFHLEDLVRENFIQTNSTMYRWGGKQGIFDNYNLAAFPADLYLHTLHAALGEIHMLPRVMAVYRRNGGGVFSSFSDHLALVVRWGEAHIELFRSLDAKLAWRYTDEYTAKEFTIMRTLVREHLKYENYAALFRIIKKYGNSAQQIFAELGLPLLAASIDDVDDVKRLLTKHCKISVLVTAYNHGAHLAQCLAGIIEQAGFFGLEIIIADDASTDTSLDIIDAYATQYPDLIRVLPVEANMGMLRNMRRGFAACAGNFIAVCEGDDYWISDKKLHRQLCTLLFDDTLSMCFNWLLLLDERNHTLQPHPQQGQIEQAFITFDDLIKQPVTANFSCCMYRRSAIDAVPLRYFEETGAADWLFNLCVATRGNLGFIKETLSVYRIHAKGQWSGLSAKQMQTARDQAAEIFPSYFADKVPQITVSPAVFTDRFLTHSSDVKFAVDTVEVYYASVIAHGWMLNSGTECLKSHHKWLVLTDHAGAVIDKQWMENTWRDDVDEAFNGAGLYAWSGFSSTLVGIPAKAGIYHLWISQSCAEGKATSAKFGQLSIGGNGEAEFRRV